MKRRLVALAVLLLLSAALSGFAAEKRLVSKKGFSVVPPKGWKVVEQTGAPAFFLGPTENRFKVNICVVGPFDVPRDSKDIVKETRQMLAGILTDYKPISARKVPHPEYQIYEMVHTSRFPNGTVKQKQWLVIQGARYFALTYSAHPKSYGKYLSAFDTCARGFRIEKL